MLLSLSILVLFILVVLRCSVTSRGPFHLSCCLLAVPSLGIVIDFPRLLIPSLGR